MYASLEPYGARCILCAQVIQRANNSSYGLAAGVFTKDLDSANHMSRSLRAGTVWINNCWFMLSPSVPFGGHQQSGVGVEGGEAGIQAYTKVCTEVTTGMLGDNGTTSPNKLVVTGPAPGEFKGTTPFYWEVYYGRSNHSFKPCRLYNTV